MWLVEKIPLAPWVELTKNLHSQAFIIQIGVSIVTLYHTCLVLVQSTVINQSIMLGKTLNKYVNVLLSTHPITHHKQNKPQNIHRQNHPPFTFTH